MRQDMTRTPSITTEDTTRAMEMMKPRVAELEAELEKAKGESWRNGGCVDCPANAENKNLTQALRTD